MVATPEFLYDQAFARNLGLVSEAEQAKLRQIRVALPGLGGVGGAHLQALVRMGVGAFNLADPDAYEVVNFNRQLGATMPTVGRGKAEVMAQMARDINPEASVRTFPDGITPKNIDAFLDGVDVVVDGIEFFRIEDRRMLYKHCRAKGIPVVNAGPIGYGASVIVFTPDGPSFDEYFAINDEMTRAEQLLAFGLGLGPGLRAGLGPGPEGRHGSQPRRPEEREGPRAGQRLHALRRRRRHRGFEAGDRAWPARYCRARRLLRSVPQPHLGLEGRSGPEAQPARPHDPLDGLPPVPRDAGAARDGKEGPRIRPAQCDCT